MMDDNYTIKFNFYLNTDRFRAVAFYPYKENKCCNKPFFILTANDKKDDGINYSCQCGCGMWCTNGHTTAQAAVDEYINMCERAKQEEKEYEVN